MAIAVQILGTGHFGRNITLAAAEVIAFLPALRLHPVTKTVVLQALALGARSSSPPEFGLLTSLQPDRRHIAGTTGFETQTPLIDISQAAPINLLDPVLTRDFRADPALARLHLEFVDGFLRAQTQPQIAFVEFEQHLAVVEPVELEIATLIKPQTG